MQNVRRRFALPGEGKKKQWFCWSSGMVNYSGTVSCIIQIAGRMKEKWWLQYFPPYQAIIAIRGTLGRVGGQFFHSFLNPMMFNSEVSTSWTNLPTCQWCCRNPANRLDVWNLLQNGKSNYCITWCRISSWTVPSISCTQIPLESPSKPWRTPESFSKIPSKTSNNKIRMFENIAPFSNNSFMQKTIRKHNDPHPSLPPPHNIKQAHLELKSLGD